MLVFFVLGALGLKAALILWGVFALAKFVTKKGDKIKEGYESKIAEQADEIKRLKGRKRETLVDALPVLPSRHRLFKQKRGDA